MVEFEEQRYGRNKNTLVDHSMLEGGSYRRKFDEISNNPKLNKLLYQLSKKILNHRSGTMQEDMYWINPETLEIVAEITDSRENLKITYTESVKKGIRNSENLITIHSHPMSSPPSLDDINCNAMYHYSLGVVVCHNGSIYIYSSEEQISREYYGRKLEEFYRELYDMDAACLAVLQKLSDDNHILFKEVTINAV